MKPPILSLLFSYCLLTLCGCATTATDTTAEPTPVAAVTGPNTERPAADATRAVTEDRRYAAIKAEQAASLFSLARDRYSQSSGAAQPHIRYAAVFDAVAIAQAVNTAWLPNDQRAEFLAWYRAASTELQQLAQAIDRNSSRHEPVAPSVPADITNASRLVASAKKTASSVNLTVIGNAVPDGKIQSCLAQCEEARSLLARSESAGADSAWAQAMDSLATAVAALKERQQLKYTLWAEKTYRDMTTRAPTSPNETMAFYRRLSEVNLSLVLEPALTREITRRLYELYDSLNTPEEKAKVRYEAITTMDKRKALADF